MIAFLLMQFTALRILDLSCNELHQIEGLEKNRVKSIQLRSISCLMSLVLLVFAYVCRISVNSSSMETKLHHLKDWKSGYNLCTACAANHDHFFLTVYQSSATSNYNIIR